MGLARDVIGAGSDDRPPLSRRRRHLAVAAVVLACGAIVWASTTAGDDAAGPATAAAPLPDGAVDTGEGAAAGRDLSEVSNEEMEEVIAENPDVIPMRLALVERYLRDGGDGDLERAHDHAAAALELDPPRPERQRALKYLGWSKALLDQPEEGARLLEQSLAIDPDDRDAQWFLANVRLVGLKDPEAAIPMLEALLVDDMTPQQRQAVETKLAAARQAAGRP